MSDKIGCKLQIENQTLTKANLHAKGSMSFKDYEQIEEKITNRFHLPYQSHPAEKEIRRRKANMPFLSPLFLQFK